MYALPAYGKEWRGDVGKRESAFICGAIMAR